MDEYKNLAISGSSLLKRNKYVDLNSFFALLLGESALVRCLSYAVIAAALFLIARSAWHARFQSAESQRLLWAGALVWTQIINIYVPVYDTVLMVPALALAAPLLFARGRKNDQVAMGLWLLALWLLPWLTQATAEFLGIQLITILLAGCGWWLLETGQQWSVATPENPIFGDSVSAEMLTN